MKIKAKTEAFIRARVWRGLTQRDLARLSGVSHSYISLLERSLKPVGPSTAKRLSDILEKPVDELFRLE